MLMVNQLIGFGVGSSAVETLVDRTTGTVIGNMTSGAAQSNCFDGTTSQALSAGAGACPFVNNAPGYVGKTYAAGKAMSRVVVYGSNDDGFMYAANPSVTITLYGKNGVPANGTDGTSLGTLTFTDTADESGGRTVSSTDTSTTYTNVWVYINGGAISTACAELVMYEML
jgi:hypothetical protein